MTLSISGTSAALFSVFMSVSFGAFAQTKATSHRLDADEYSIYSSIVNTQLNWKGVTKIVIRDRTGISGLITAKMADGKHQFEAYLRKAVPGVSSDTAADFYEKAAQTGLLENRLRVSLPYFLVTAQDETLIFSSRTNGWQNFYQRYPGAQGLLAFSLIGFNSARSQALVYYADQSNYVGGAGYLVLLTKKKDAWAIVKQDMLWIS